MRDCIIYRGFLNHDGYAYSNSEPVVRRLWREAWGAIPQGMEIAHICDIRACINLAHVYLATHADNMKDRWERTGYRRQVKQ